MRGDVRAVERSEGRLERAAAGEGDRVLLLIGVAADTADGLGEIFPALCVALRRSAPGRHGEKQSKCTCSQRSENGRRASHFGHYASSKKKPRRSGAFGRQRFLVLLLAEILVAGAAGLADGPDRRLLSGLIA